MIIDWYTIIFQIINFLILVFLLRFFLYSPITKMMDEREQKIIEREEKAEESRREAEEEAEEYRRNKSELDNRREKLLEEAHTAAEDQKSELLKQARSEVVETRKRWELALEREQEAFSAELRRRIGLQASALARRCLSDLADVRLEELAWEHFLVKIDDMEQADRRELQKGLSESNNQLNLRSAFEITDRQQKNLEQKITDLIPGNQDHLQVILSRDNALICGLELEAGGYRVSWNIDSYLDGVEAGILKELNQLGREKEQEEVPTGEAEAE